MQSVKTKPEPIRIGPPTMRDMKTVIKCLLWVGLGLVALVAILSAWPYQLVASPNSKLRIVDEAGKPLAGVRIVRDWRTSEEQKGTDENVTDSNGEVSFKRVAFSMSLLRRITKPFLIFVPAMCGPSWEVYGHSEFRIYWPAGYTLKFGDKDWKRMHEVFKNTDGVCIRDPEITRQFRHENYVELYFYNKRHDFDHTLKLYRQDAK